MKSLLELYIRHLMREIHLPVTYEVWARFWINLQRPISKAVFKVHKNNNARLRVGLLCYVIRCESERYWFVRFVARLLFFRCEVAGSPLFSGMVLYL
jgi:hypothetical protein